MEMNDVKSLFDACAALDLPQTVTTKVAAELLGRAQITLLRWSSQGGPIQPVKIFNGKKSGPLRWKLSDIRRLLEGGAF